MNSTQEMYSNTIDSKEIVDVTIILNIWKRNYIEEQLTSIFSQTVLPKEIWIVHYEDHIKTEQIVEKFKNLPSRITLIRSEKNLMYFGRFSIAINVSTKFTWIVDDDVIPGNEWVERCTIKCDTLNAIISCTGRIIPKDNFRPEEVGSIDRKRFFVGDMTYIFKNSCAKDTMVDYGCNSYFFKSEWLKAFWGVWPATFLSGEDIHLSATCKYVLGIDTYVIEQTDNKSCGNTKKAYGSDSVASWKQDKFIETRESVLKFHIVNNKWTPIEW